ncbi:hypothetical protein ABZU22_24005 [Micromonospora sp. NPDC005222]|uniref:hypothetical protein n=1 Tax=Micromonospora sp. NPDC005222 TaxID=3157025 RepID=UPI0033B444D2
MSDANLTENRDRPQSPAQSGQRRDPTGPHHAGPQLLVLHGRHHQRDGAGERQRDGEVDGIR